jgi:hypothetical protein
MTTRRGFLQFAASAAGAFAVGSGTSSAAAAPPLIDAVAETCRRLAPLGWRELLLDVTAGALDITAADLKGALATPLPRIDRSVPGFGDFAADGNRAIEPGRPERSLLYHALASPAVIAARQGAALGDFASLAEIDAVENYVYGVTPPTLQELRRRADGRPLGMVVFALQYQTAPQSVRGRHAELCFARSGISRLGTIEPLYDAKARNFTALDPARPFDFRVVPRRFAAYLAVQMSGAPDRFGPQDALADDRERQFWVPVHKLFDGRECIAGLDLHVRLRRGLRNEELADFHRFLDRSGLQNNWSGEVLEQFPFTIKDAMIGSMSRRPELGESVLEPRASPLTTPAEYRGRLLTFPVDGRYTSNPLNLQLSSMQILPLHPGPSHEPHYFEDAEQDTERPAPEYINIRHRVLPNGAIDNLNLRPDMDEIIHRGGYQALHYIDSAGDGWIEAHCAQLADVVDARVPAYCMVALPDFFPRVTHRALMQWWRDEVPKPVRAALWAIPPLALSQTRIAANITLPIGFSLKDTTMTAIVSQEDAPGPVQTPNGPINIEKTGLPDGSPGLFDPGWDTSQGIYYTAPEEPLEKFLTARGLGSPFIEDAKLCAALGAYWPGVAPDSTRTFQPDKRISGEFYPYPTIVPLTDEEIGSAPVEGGKLMPWDGVHGPRATTFNNKPVCAYTNAFRVDYIDLVGTMTAALTARIDMAEYKARTLAMEAVYWALGIHDPEYVAKYGEKEAVFKVLGAKAAWAVLSFRSIDANDSALAAAQQAAGTKLTGPRHYAFHVYRWGHEYADPNDMNIVYLEMLDQAFAYVSGNTVLLRHDNGSWTTDRSMPT